MSAPLDLEVVIVSHGAEELLRRCLRLAARAPAASGDDAGDRGRQRQPRRDAGHGRARVPRVAAAAPRQHRLLGRQQPRPARETRRRRCCCSTPTPRSTPGPSTPALARLPRTPRIGMVGGKLVHRERASSTTPASAPSPPRSAPSPTSPGSAAARTPASRSSQYRATHLGDDEPGEVDAVNGAFMLCRAEAVARGRPARRGLLALHGGPRLVPPLLGRGLEGLLRARPASPCTSRVAPAASAGRPNRRSPSTAAWAASTAASTPPSTTRC